MFVKLASHSHTHSHKHNRLYSTLLWKNNPEPPPPRRPTYTTCNLVHKITVQKASGSGVLDVSSFGNRTYYPPITPLFIYSRSNRRKFLHNSIRETPVWPTVENCCGRRTQCSVGRCDLPSEYRVHPLLRSDRRQPCSVWSLSNTFCWITHSDVSFRAHESAICVRPEANSVHIALIHFLKDPF